MLGHVNRFYSVEQILFIRLYCKNKINKIELIFTDISLSQNEYLTPTEREMVFLTHPSLRKGYCVLNM